MKVAIIGSGAAAVGALKALKLWAPDSHVTLFESGRQLESNLETTIPSIEWSRRYYGDLYSDLRKTYKLKFPPPKTHFGKSAPQISIKNWGNIWASNIWGGLTNYWGGSVFPFTSNDLRSWNLDADALAPYYKIIAGMIGIAGKDDELTKYLGEDYVNRPEIEVPNIVNKLEKTVNNPQENDELFNLTAGSSRVALETRIDHENRCLYSGECMVGCSTRSIYSARGDIDKFISSGVVNRVVRQKVESLDLRLKKLNLNSGTSGSFDRVYICAGCVGTAEILLRSGFGVERALMYDNSVFTFPIIYSGKSLRRLDKVKYFALSNLFIVCEPSSDEEYSAFIQVYPNIDHLWRYFIPVSLWGLVQPIAERMRERILWGRLYLHSEYSQRYELRLNEGDELQFSLKRSPRHPKNIDGLLSSIRKSLGRDGFHVPRFPLVMHSTSSHYSSTFPAGAGIIDENCQASPGIYLCDSSVFNDGPSSSPTFTIMANACRIVRNSI